MSQESVNIINLLIAIIGAFTGTFALFLEFYKVLIENYKIQIQYQPNMRIPNGAPLYNEDAEYIAITVTNQGRRTVRIGNVSLRMLSKTQKEHHYILTDSLLIRDNTRVLTEENPSTQYLVEKEGINLDEIYYIAVFDEYGKKHRKYLHKFPTFWHIKKIIFDGYK